MQMPPGRLLARSNHKFKPKLTPGVLFANQRVSNPVSIVTGSVVA
jgi:hypothetical protein